jgi:predicted phosphodiesterase
MNSHADVPSRSFSPSVAIWRFILLVSLILSVLVPGVGLLQAGTSAQAGGFTCALAVDQRHFTGSEMYDTPAYFRGALEAINRLGPTAFLVSPGDIDPPADSIWTIKKYLDADYLWYPGVGNHETETPDDMAHLRGYDYDANGAGVEPNIVNWGPSGCPNTTYSFDYQNVHFVMLNEYYDVSGDNLGGGDITDHLYSWLATDLAATAKPFIFVMGHEPAYPRPDEDNGRLRHSGDSLDAYPEHRDRFWNLLKSEGGLAYITGHTHNYSTVKVNGVWQIDVGHARGNGDTGAPSTFVLIHVDGDTVTFDAYRQILDGVWDYHDIMHHGHIYPSAAVYLPMRKD